MLMLKQNDFYTQLSILHTFTSNEKLEPFQQSQIYFEKVSDSWSAKSNLKQNPSVHMMKTLRYCSEAIDIIVQVYANCKPILLYL